MIGHDKASEIRQSYIVVKLEREHIKTDHREKKGKGKKNKSDGNQFLVSFKFTCGEHNRSKKF